MKPTGPGVAEVIGGTEETRANTSREVGSLEADYVQDLAGGFEELVGAARPALLRAAHSVTGRHEDAEDAVQSSLLKAMRAWQRVAGQERWRQQAYVRQIVVNTCRSGWRKWGSRVAIGDVPEVVQRTRDRHHRRPGVVAPGLGPAAGTPAGSAPAALLRGPDRGGDSQEAGLRPRDGEELGGACAAVSTRHAPRGRRQSHTSAGHRCHCR